MNNRVLNFIIKKIDNFVINNLTVERGRNKRKYIWKTHNFKEITLIYIPKLAYISFVVFMCWKINEKVKNITGNNNMSVYTAKSRREERVEEEKEVSKII